MNFKNQIQNLEEQLQSKDKLINQLLEKIQSIAYKHNSPNTWNNTNSYTFQKKSRQAHQIQKIHLIE